MQNQKSGIVGQDSAMFEQFKKFMSQQQQQQQQTEPLHPKEKTFKFKKRPVITVSKVGEQVPPPLPPPDDSTDDEIELKPRTLGVSANARGCSDCPKQIKPKRQITEKQMENLIKGREKRDALRKQRLDEKAKQAEEYKKQVEEKLVKKAIQIKKKQLKEQKLIEPDPESDDNETMIKSKPKRTAPSNPHLPQPQAQQRKFYFV